MVVTFITGEQGRVPQHLWKNEKPPILETAWEAEFGAGEGVRTLDHLLGNAFWMFFIVSTWPR
jgi:hypothetical protein